MTIPGAGPDDLRRPDAIVRAVPIDIRQVRDPELVAYVDALSTGFLERPDVAKVAEEVRPYWDLSRVWAAVDGEVICGTFRSWPSELTVPGGASLRASAVSAVTVRPTHRRRGILRSMMAAEHAAMRERGEHIGLLHSAEYPIYGRFGYGTATREATWNLDALGAVFHGSPSGSIDLVTADADSVATARAVFEAWRLATPGEIRRRDVSWDYDFALRPSAWGEDWKGFVALHRDDDGTPDGYARFGGGDDKWVQRQPRSTIKLNELHALSDEANADLWRFLASLDWVATIKAERRSPSDRLPWLLVNARAADVSEIGDGLWIRVFDVAEALAARTYEREGRIVLEVIDAEADRGRQRVVLVAGPDGATCVPTTAAPDLTLDVSALSAAYLGGPRLRDTVIATGVDEHRPGALLDAEALLRTADEPWCSTFF